MSVRPLDILIYVYNTPSAIFILQYLCSLAIALFAYKYFEFGRNTIEDEAVLRNNEKCVGTQFARTNFRSGV